MSIDREIEIDTLRGSLMKMLGYAEMYFKRWPGSDSDRKAVEDARGVLQALPGDHRSAVMTENDKLRKYIDDEVAAAQAKNLKLQSVTGDLIAVINAFREANPVIGIHVVHNPQLTQRAYELSALAINRAESVNGV